MPVKLNSSGGGSVTLDVPVTASNFTLTLPALNGTVDVNSGFPSGTALLFVQTAAPTGWTKSTAHDNKALRVVSGTASSGGSVAFTTAFASQAVSGTVGNTTLTTSQIPSHTHAIFEVPGGTYFKYGSFGPAVNETGDSGATGGGGSHNHSFTGTAINLAVQYVDVIIATKN